MSLFSWIKNKFYEGKLSNAKKQVAKANYLKAEQILSSLLGKKPEAVIELSNIYVKRATDVKSLVDVLSKIDELKQYLSEENKEEYALILAGHIKTMQEKACFSFKHEKYEDAVSLVVSLRPFVKDKSFSNTIARYHAYLSFSKSLITPDYKKELSILSNYLKQYQDGCIDDIKIFVDKYAQKKRFVRAISLISEFISIYPELKKLGINQVIHVVDGKDFENSKYHKLSDFVSDEELKKAAADELLRLSYEVASKKDYHTAVLYDSFVAEFFSGDNQFNMDRCVHIACDIITRVLPEKVNDLFSLASQLNLTSEQISVLKDKVKEMFKVIGKAHKQHVTNDISLKNVQSALIALDDIEYLLEFTEKLYKEGCELIKCFYIEQKKKFISEQLSIANFDRAECEIKSLQGIDEEAETILVEIYYAKAQTLTDKQKLSLYCDIVNVIDGGKVQSSFDEKKNLVLEWLTEHVTHEYQTEHQEQAYAILELIKNQHRYWLPLYMYMRTQDNKNIKVLTQQIKHVEESINKLVDTVYNLKEYSLPCIQEFWDYYKDLIVKKSKSQPKEKALDSFKGLRNYLLQYVDSSIAQERITNISLQIVKLQWSFANENEAENEFEKAIKNYDEIKSENIASYAGRAELRSLICLLKAGKMEGEYISRAKNALRDIKSHEQLKEDLAYRLGLYFLKVCRADDAEEVFSKYLSEFDNNLKNMCQIARLQWAKSVVDKVNKELEGFVNNEVSAQEAENTIINLQYGSDLDDAERILGIEGTLSSVIESISKYVQRKSFEEEEYVSAIRHIINDNPKYLNNTTVFHNLFIASLGAIEHHQAYEEYLYQYDREDGTIERCIAICLTAIYTDNLFVKSLENTSWDDSYTFTIKDSLGGTSLYEYDDAPDNLNEDEPTDKNISIKEVQKSLLTRLEVAVRENYSEFESFLNEQKTALDNLVELRLDQSCTINCPCLARDNKDAFDSVKSAFDYELLQNYGTKEDVIALGVQFGFTDPVYANYKDAKVAVVKCKQSLSQSLTTIRTAFNRNTITSIKEYKKLYASLKAIVSNDINDAIRGGIDYIQFLDKYEIICKALNDSSLSFAFAQHANGEIVRRLNDKVLKLRDGAYMLTRVYLVAPGSEQVKQNLEGVLAAFVVEVEKRGHRVDKDKLDSIRSIADTTITNIIDEAQIQAQLSVIVDKVNNNEMEKYIALEKVYNMYSAKRLDKRICENLVTLCSMCIMEYIVGAHYRSYSVENILDRLNDNKSSMFNSCAKKLAQEYRTIWNQLPAETKILIQHGFNMNGATLNSKGEALKKGLEYLKRLGNVIDTPDNDIFSRLGRFGL